MFDKIMKFRIGDLTDELIKKMNELTGIDMSDYEVEYENTGNCVQEGETTCCEYKVITASDCGFSLDLYQILPKTSDKDGLVNSCWKSYNILGSCSEDEPDGLFFTESCMIGQGGLILESEMNFSLLKQGDMEDPALYFPLVSVCE